MDGAGGSGTDHLVNFDPRLDGRLLCQFNSAGAGTGNCTPWVAHPDNVKDFFQTGHTASVRGSSRQARRRRTPAFRSDPDNTTGIIPNNFVGGTIPRRCSAAASR